MQDAEPQVQRREDYTPPRHLVDETSLRFDIDDAATTVTAELRVRRNPQGVDALTDLELDGAGAAEMELL